MWVKVQSLLSRYENATSNFCWVSYSLLGVLCNLLRRFFRDCICVDTYLPRFEALAYVLPLFDTLTHVVIRVFIFQTFAEVC